MIGSTVPTTPLNNAYQGGPFFYSGVLMIPSESSVKRPTTFEEQITILKSRGLIIDDEDKAKRVLERVNYYRLSAYSLSLKRDDKFHPGVTFEHVVALYEFDQRFRYLLMEMVEQIEIAFRTHIAYHIAHKYGPLGHLETEHFCRHELFLVDLEKEIKRSQEIFIKHHVDKYGRAIPVWVAVEVLSFGALSKLFSNMKVEDQKQISNQYYRVPAVYLVSWLKCLAYIRNICAHYGRLYNRPLTSKPKLFRSSRRIGINQGRVFAHIYIIRELIPGRRRWKDFVIRLEALITEYKDIVEFDRIGFPEDWESILVRR